MTTVQLLVDGTANERALRSLVDDAYEVETGTSVTEADVYVVDDVTLCERRDALRERVQECQPVFCPVLLVRRSDTPHQLRLPDPEETDDPLLVDDVVDAPVDSARLNRRLKTLVVRRNQSKELRDYVTKLEDSNDRLEQFAYAASHDLQEPLRMVSSYLRLIEQRYADELDEECEEYLEFAVDGADRMRSMIEGLLQYARIESEGQPMEPVDLDDVLEDVLRDLELQIEESGAEITTDSLPRVEGDASQLRQVLQNLLTNAITYSGDEPPRVHVGATRRDGEWEISVADEGVGIDPSEQERIFAVFDRLHSREEHEGTGIGLALCRRIVDRHGGDIWVESDPGEGSTFTFTLPAAE